MLLAACAEFDDTAASEDWQPAPELTPERGPQPELPEAQNEQNPQEQREEQESIPPPDGCTDHDPAVIATCLDPISDVAALPPDGMEIASLAAERESGAIYRATEGSDAEEIITLDVDASEGGGLSALALSPNYVEDQLVYAYLSTESDNRVVRVAEDGEPTPVVTGIPKGESGNDGSLAVDHDGALLVATGDAGDQEEAADPDSLAGKVLRIDSEGDPAPDNPDADSRVITSGLHSPGGLCTSADGSRTWVTDRGADSEAIYAIEPGEPLSSPAWSWDDEPGLAGCADWSDTVMITTSNAGDIRSMPVDEDGSVTSEPQISGDGDNGDGYGQLSSVDRISEELAVAGTVNNDGGDPVSSDDRVVVLPRPEADAGGAD